MFLLTINRYLKGLERSVPISVYETTIIIIVVGFLLFIALKGVRKGIKYGLRLLLADYVLIILCSTVFFRSNCAVAKYSYLPFRTYNEYINGNTSLLLLQAILNIIIFIPIGLLLKLSFKSLQWWQLLLIGCVLSLIIEVSQLVLHRGFCEFDDVMHNGLGCLVGIMLFHIISKIRVTRRVCGTHIAQKFNK